MASEEQASGSHKDRILASFKKFDLNGDGVIDKDELKEILQAVGLPLAIIDPVFEKADANKDGKIDFKEFVDWIFADKSNEGSTMRSLAQQPDWPKDWSVRLAPQAIKPDKVKVSAPVHLKEDDVVYWCAGGPTKARIRIADDAGALKLEPEYTVGIRFMLDKGGGPGYDTLVMGHDGKHWLGVECGGQRRLICADSKTNKTSTLAFSVPADKWVVIFLQPRGDRTAVLVIDDDGLFEVGTFEAKFVGSKLDKLGWADSNEVKIAEVLLWTRCVPWQEMSGSVPRIIREAPKPEPLEKPPAVFRGQVVDLDGKGIPDVRVGWMSDFCKTDEDGCFSGTIEDAETDVPDDASQRSGGSTSSCSTVMSFTKEGFAPMTSRAQCQPGASSEAGLLITLRQISASKTMDLTEGGSVVDEKTGSSVTVKPNSLCYADGTPCEGPVTVNLSVIDVTDPKALASMPGDFSAVGEGGASVMLQSLGACWIGASDESGKELKVKEGEGVDLDLKSNATADLEKLQTNAELWSFNEETGKWELETQTPLKVNGELVQNSAAEQAPKSSQPRTGFKGKKKMKGRYSNGTKEEMGYGLEEGCMTADAFKDVVKRGGEKSLATSVQKLGYINCDLAYHHPQRAVMMTGLVVGSDGEPLPSLQLWSVGRDYQGRCPDVTDKDGKFGVLIAQFDSEVDIEVQLKVPVVSDAKLNVYYDERNSRSYLSRLSKKLKFLVQVVEGSYIKEKDASVWKLESSQKNEDGNAYKMQIAWSSDRRCWQHTVDGTVIFVKDGDEKGEETSPFGSGWRVPASLTELGAEKVVPPMYAKPVKIEAQMKGPFKTGPPGEFFDCGKIVVSDAVTS